MKRLSAICLPATALLLLSFFIVLFLAIRPDPDDMIISLDIREHSLYYALKMRYLYSSFRTTLIVSDAFVLGSNDASTNPVRIFLYYCANFIVLTLALYMLQKRMLVLATEKRKDKFLLMSSSIVLSGAIYFLCSSRIEVFGWLGASEGHLVPMVFVLLTAAILLKPGFSFADILLLLFSVLIIAGGAEHINVLVILVNMHLLYLAYKKKTISVDRKKLLVFSLFHFVCFAVFFSNPGVWHRVHDVNEAQTACYDTGNFFTMFFQPYKLVGVIVAIFVGVFLRNYFTVSLPTPRIQALIALGGIIFLVCFFMGLAAYHTYELGRIWLPFDIFLCFCFVAIGLNSKVSHLMNGTLGMIVVVLVFAHDYRHIPALWNFRTQYDNVVHQLQNTQEEETLVIKDFPAPDLVNLVALSDSSGNEINTLFCKFYGSQAKIVVENDHSKSR